MSTSSPRGNIYTPQPSCDRASPAVPAACTNTSHHQKQEPPHFEVEKKYAGKAEEMASKCKDNGLKSSRRFQCQYEGCQKVFPRRYNLKVHLRKHTGENPYLCPFERCGKRFRWRSSIVHHYKSHLCHTLPKLKNEEQYMHRNSNGEKPMHEQKGEQIGQVNDISVADESSSSCDSVCSISKPNDEDRQSHHHYHDDEKENRIQRMNAKNSVTKQAATNHTLAVRMQRQQPNIFQVPANSDSYGSYCYSMEYLPNTRNKKAEGFSTPTPRLTQTHKSQCALDERSEPDDRDKYRFQRDHGHEDVYHKPVGVNNLTGRSRSPSVEEHQQQLDHQHRTLSVVDHTDGLPIVAANDGGSSGEHMTRQHSISNLIHSNHENNDNYPLGHVSVALNVNHGNYGEMNANQLGMGSIGGSVECGHNDDMMNAMNSMNCMNYHIGESACMHEGNIMVGDHQNQVYYLHHYHHCDDHEYASRHM